MSKKALSLGLALLLCLTMVLAGCGGKQDNQGKENLPPKEGESGGETESPSSESNFNEEGLPIVNEPVTLHMIAVLHSLTDELHTIKSFQEMEEKTNVKIDWEYVRQSGWNENKNMLLASGDLPDAFFGGYAIEASDITSNLEYFVPMEDYIDKYAPNIQKMFEDEPDTKKLSTAPDGHIYSLPHVMPLRPVTFDTGFINKAWLDKVGMDVPTTTDEFYDVLKAFKEKDPNGNGKADEIPMTGIPGNTLAGFRSLFGAFGVVDNIENWLHVDDGKVYYSRAMEEYKEAIQYFHKLYKEGLIDQEAFTQDWSQMKSKHQNEEIAIVGVGFHWTIPTAVGNERAKEYVQLPALKGPNGDQYWRHNPSFVRSGGCQFEMTHKNENPEVTMRWIDQWYDEEMSLQLYFGPIGVGLEKTDDGKYNILPPPEEGTTFDSWVWKNTLGDSGPVYVSREMEAKVIPNDWVTDKMDLDEGYAPYIKDDVYPSIMWDKETNDRLAILNADIGNLADSKMASWIVDGGVENEWDDYINQLNQMGLEELIDIYQKGYDEYNK